MAPLFLSPGGAKLATRRHSKPKDSAADLLKARAIRWEWEQEVEAATENEPYDQKRLTELLAKGRRLFGSVELPKDSRDWWEIQHRLEPGSLPDRTHDRKGNELERPHPVPPRDTILGCDPRIRQLEYEFVVEAHLNREIGQEYQRQRAIAAEISEEEAAAVERPELPIACRWIGQLPRLNHYYIGRLSLPQLNPLTGRATVVDWEQLVAWKVDVEAPLSSLTRPQRQVYQRLWAGYELEEIKRQLGWSWPVLLQTVRDLNATLRQWAEADA